MSSIIFSTSDSDLRIWDQVVSFFVEFKRGYLFSWKERKRKVYGRVVRKEIARSYKTEKRSEFQKDFSRGNDEFAYLLLRVHKLNKLKFHCCLSVTKMLK